jgi:pimeloyl-ACP methyl ester carboxylesterase
MATLENRFSGLEIDEIRVGETPVTIYRALGEDPAPPVILAHGFAGSRQMMDQIAVSLARQGFLVASVDLPGHGRHRGRLSPDINSLDGTTAQLVETIEQVADVIVVRADTTGPVSYVGHSMATDVVIRAAEARDDVGGVVGISMYSPAVTDKSPAALLALSGATENHLRDAALDAVRQIEPEAREGETATRNGVTRGAAVAPLVGHVGVLYAPKSLEEITSWLREVVGAGEIAPLDRSGWIVAVLLAALTLLAWPLAAALPKRSAAPVQPILWRTFLACLIVPIAPAIIVAVLPTFGIAGNAGFGTLAAIFGAWGVVQIMILYRAGHRLDRPDMAGALVYLCVASLFALALDRYGAAFLPTGERIIVLFGLMIGTLPLMIADTWLVRDASLLRRLLLRLAFLIALSAAMALAPTELGLAFTTLPVLVLFFLVYGTMARWVAARRGASGVALGKAVVLAWAIATSTPLFAVVPVS